MSQKRTGSGGDGEDEKFRITVELRHAILNFFDVGAVPVYKELPPVMVVYGVHGRIDNIDADRRWVQDEKFHIGDHEVIRKKGQKAPGNFMENWLKVRDADPQIFKEIIVMQQPAATVDEVIVAWELEDLAKRVPGAVLQRDLQSGALTTRSRMAALCLHIIP